MLPGRRRTGHQPESLGTDAEDIARCGDSLRSAGRKGGKRQGVLSAMTENVKMWGRPHVPLTPYALQT